MSEHGLELANVLLGLIGLRLFFDERHEIIRCEGPGMGRPVGVGKGGRNQPASKIRPKLPERLQFIEGHPFREFVRANFLQQVAHRHAQSQRQPKGKAAQWPGI